MRGQESGFFYTQNAAPGGIYFFSHPCYNEKNERGNHMKKLLLRICAIVLTVVLLGLAAGSIPIIRSMDGRGEPGGKILIVLGTTVNGTEPSPMLRQRLDAAVEYLNTYPDAKCIVTGGKGDEHNLSEAQCMWNCLTAAGIAPDRVQMEDRATSTVENLRNVHAMLDTNEVDILSSDFHLYRSGLIAKDAGFIPTLIPAKTQPLSLLAPWFLREIFALYAYLLS